MKLLAKKLSPQDLLPFGILAFYLVVAVLIRLYLPPAQVILDTVAGFYRTFGYPFVLFSGLLESLFLIGFYFPGSAAILLGAAIARTGAVSLPLVIFFSTVGFMVGYTINYYLGKFGWYKILARMGFEKGIHIAGEKLEKHGEKALFLSYFSPNTASLISTAAGVTKYPFKKFFFVSLLSQTFWSILWGSITFMLGDIFVELFAKYATFIVYGILAIVIIRQFWKRGKSTKPKK